MKYISKIMPVSFDKFTNETIGRYAHMGGISTATILSTTYLNEWGDTCVDVIWDNEPGYVIREELARELRLKGSEKDPNADNLINYYAQFG